MRQTKILLIALICLLTGCQPESNISVTVKNVDELRMDSVEITVTGNTYQLGSLIPGDSVTTKVYPQSESHLEILMHNSRRGKKGYIVGTYFEPGYSGFLKVSINSDSIVSITDSISIQ